MIRFMYADEKLFVRMTLMIMIIDHRHRRKKILLCLHKKALRRVQTEEDLSPFDNELRRENEIC